MRLVSIAIPIAAAFALAAPAWADGPVTTANQTPAPQSSAPAPPLGDSSAYDDSDGPTQVIGPCGPTKAKADGSPDAAPHGEVEAGIGTGGYRHIAGRVCKPIGDNGAVSVSVSDTQYGGEGRRR